MGIEMAYAFFSGGVAALALLLMALPRKKKYPANETERMFCAALLTTEAETINKVTTAYLELRDGKDSDNANRREEILRIAQRDMELAVIAKELGTVPRTHDPVVLATTARKIMEKYGY